MRSLSLTASEVRDIGRADGGERGMGFVGGKKVMAVDGGELERERARGGTSSVRTIRVQKKLGIALLGRGVPFSGDAACFACEQFNMLGTENQRSVGGGGRRGGGGGRGDGDDWFVMCNSWALCADCC